MKKKVTRKYAAAEVHELRPEYDFRGGERGKHAERYAEGTNIVMLDPDVAEVFPDSESVNNALRALLPIVRSQKKRPRREPRRA